MASENGMISVYASYKHWTVEEVNFLLLHLLYMKALKSILSTKYLKELYST